jgi:transcriptional regulator with XRE-family HTH domain
MKDRLLLFMNRENISAAALADEIGVQRSSISHILSGRNNPSYDFIYKMIIRYDKINPEWLIAGRGEMYKKEEEDNRLSATDEINQTMNLNKQNVTEKDNQMKDPDSIRQRNEFTEISKTEQVTNVNKIEKIVYFYKNGTFKEYNPSE